MTYIVVSVFKIFNSAPLKLFSDSVGLDWEIFCSLVLGSLVEKGNACCTHGQRLGRAILPSLKICRAS